MTGDIPGLWLFRLLSDSYVHKEKTNRFFHFPILVSHLNIKTTNDTRIKEGYFLMNLYVIWVHIDTSNRPLLVIWKNADLRHFH